MVISWFTHLYGVLLRFYPRGFQEEFGEEMQEAFSLALSDARSKGRLALGRFFLSEMTALPLSVAQIWRHDAQTRAGSARHAAGERLWEQSWREVLLGLVVFLLPAWMALINQPAEEAAVRNLPAALLFLVVMTGLGWLGGFPLWSRPYLGLVLVIAGYLHVFMWIGGLISPALISNFTPGPWNRDTYLVLQVVSSGMMWLMLFCLTLLVVALLAVFNRFQPLLKRVRHDWTLLSYILYGEAAFALLLLWSNGARPDYALTSLVCMGAGIWFFLNSAANWQRVLALLTCLTLAMSVAALGKGAFSLSQAWASWLELRPSESGRLLLSWLGMAAALLLPGLLAQLQGGRSRAS